MRFTRNFFLILLLLVFVSGNFVSAFQTTSFGYDRRRGRDITDGERIDYWDKSENSRFIEIAPPIEFIYPSPNQRISGVIEIEVEVERAVEINFYLLRPGSLAPIYLGKGDLDDEDEWIYLWNTLNTPNGDYQLFAKVANQRGTYQSQKIRVIVNNIIEESVAHRERIQELRKITEQIQDKEKYIVETINQATEDITEEVSILIDKVSGEILEADPYMPEAIEKSIEETEAIVEAGIEEIASGVQEGRRLKKEIIKRAERTERAKERIKEKEEELEELEEIGLPGIIEEKIERIQREKGLIIVRQQEQKEKAEREAEEKEKRLLELEEQKELRKEEIIRNSLRPLEIIKEQVYDPSKVLELRANTVQRIEEKIAVMEKDIAEEERARGEMEEEALRDSDGDGLPDFLEIEIGSDSFNPDTDGDGYLDGQEAALGLDPLVPFTGERIIHQDPRRVEPKKEDIFIVDRAEIKISEVLNLRVLRIEGRALPNVFVTIHVFSLPVVVVTRTDAHGRWVYEFDKPLSPGEHEVYVVLTNNKGEITARSEAFNFVKSGTSILQLIPEVWAREAGREMERVVHPYDVLRRSFIILTLATIILALGIALLVIGFLSKRKESFYFSSKKSISSPKE